MTGITVLGRGGRLVRWLVLLLTAALASGCWWPLSTRGTVTPSPVASTPAPAATTVAATRHEPTVTPRATKTALTPPAATRAPTATASPALVLALPPGAVRAQLVKVIDGDTIDVLIGGEAERVRYVGVDTPERSQPGYRSATDANRRLLGAGPLYLVRDVSDRDKTSDHRLLRYVYRADGVLVEAELVRQGWAQPVEYRPDIRFAAEFRRLAVEAAKAGRGFWTGTAPADGAMPYGLTTAAAEVRKGPGAAYPTSGNVTQDTPMTVYGRTAAGDWLQVRTPTRMGGWIAASAVRLNVPMQQVPLSEKTTFSPLTGQRR